MPDIFNLFYYVNLIDFGFFFVEEEVLIVEEYTVGLGGGTHSPTALLVLTHNHPQQQLHIYIVLSKAEFTEFSHV